MLIEERFGPLPPEAVARLANAGPSQLQAWGKAVLHAPTLDAVFSAR
jgi:hypothetical protein